MELTKWIKDKGVDKTMAPAAIVAYAEYPKGSGKYWAVPEYAELLEVCQRKWHAYVVAGQGTAKEAMDGIAKEWEAIFEKAGYYKK